MPFELAPLPYDYAALEPHIDEQTMRLHHDKHHATYVAKLNRAVPAAPELAGKSVEQLLRDLAGRIGEYAGMPEKELEILPDVAERVGLVPDTVDPLLEKIEERLGEVLRLYA